MDTNNVDNHVILRDPSELIAAVPHMLGFHPERSLVLVTVGDPADTMVIRVDLPEPDQYELLAAQLRGRLVWHDIAKVVLIVVHDTTIDPGATLPYRGLASLCQAHFAEAGINAGSQFWAAATVGGAPWSSYHDRDVNGLLPHTNALAQATGGIVYAQREDLVASLTPDDDDALARRADLLAAYHDVDPRDGLRLVDAAVARAIDGILPDTDHDIVALAAALCDYTIRDASLIQPDTVHFDAAERLWIALTRLTPTPERAEPASLLAFVAIQRGRGTLANVAVDCAEAADPAHRLTEMLRIALTIGCTPPQMRQTAEQAGTASRDLLRHGTSGGES